MSMSSRANRVILASSFFVLAAVTHVFGQDVAGSKDPDGMKRYEGSELIGYRAPKFDEYLLPLGPPTEMSPPAYKKSKQIEGQVSYYTYLAPEGRTPAELFRNYKQEFARLGLEVQYEKAAGQPGWFGPTFNEIAEDVRGVSDPGLQRSRRAHGGRQEQGRAAELLRGVRD